MDIPASPQALLSTGHDITTNSPTARLRKPKKSNEIETAKSEDENGEAKPRISKSLSTSWTSNLIRSSADRLAAWEASRTDAQGIPLHPPGHYRPLTPENVTMALRLAPWTLIELTVMFWKVAGLKLVLFFFGRVWAGLVPAWQSIALANLYTCAQETLVSPEKRDIGRIFRLTLIHIVAAHHQQILELFDNPEKYSLSAIDEEVEYLYLRAQLSLDIPALSDSRTSALAFEAGAFAGFERRVAIQGYEHMSGASSQITDFAGVLTTVITLFSGGALLFGTIWQKSGGTINMRSIIFMIAMFAPSFLGFIQPRGRAPAWLLRWSKRDIQAMGTNGQYKQEILLFGLADWVMEKWRVAVDQQRDQMTTTRDTSFLIISLVRDSMRSTVYCLLALGAFPHSVTFGDLRLCSDCAQSLVTTVTSLHGQVSAFVEYVFLGTAFLETLKLQERLTHPSLDLIEYAPITHANGRRGMRIEARNLSFTYPGQTEPALKNINLTVEPGETLAIVGFNGGGKTTLVKVLMGLFAHSSGTLLINSTPIESYLRSSLHAHTTVCFQDYAKYNFSVKENVGTGNYTRMDDAELLNEALRKGGADAVVKRLPKGVDEELNKDWIPPTEGEGGAGAGQPSSSMLPPPPPPPGPPPPGKGRGGGPPSFSLTLNRGQKGGRGRGGPAMRAQMMAMRGKPLSGGQWQRIALARAFMRSDEADLVVFDEPSASLDARAEHELFERIHSLSLDEETKEKIRTTLYVSHRFSTTRRADKIAVVEDGTISELGSHDELMQIEGGRYAEFFNLQAKGFLG
ncbi:hypothetical protein FRB95_010076 [Tulasnella sp. JGI-2019a]|nr:hypothetical protein FRB95_010076 [Tulasnella sp. JGI-2019a]